MLTIHHTASKTPKNYTILITIVLDSSCDLCVGQRDRGYYIAIVMNPWPREDHSHFIMGATMTKKMPLMMISPYERVPKKDSKLDHLETCWGDTGRCDIIWCWFFGVCVCVHWEEETTHGSSVGQTRRLHTRGTDVWDSGSPSPSIVFKTGPVIVPVSLSF